MPGIKRPALHCVLVSLLNGFIYGYSTIIVSGISKPVVNQAFGYFDVPANYSGSGSNWPCEQLVPSEKISSSQDATNTWIGVYTANILLGNFIGALVGPALADKYGRRPAMVMNAIIATAFPLLLAFIPDFNCQLALRTVYGVCIGVCATVGPNYVTEVAPPERRGRLGTLFQVAICASILVGQIINFAFNPNSIDHCMPQWRWRLQLGLGAVPGLLTLLYSFFFMPESTEWLDRQLKRDAMAHGEGNSGVVGIHSTIDVSRPLAGIDEEGPYASNNSTLSASLQIEDAPSGYSALCSRRGLKWLLVVLGLPMCQQLTGINAIMFYGPEIIKESGLPNPLLINFLAIGAWNLMSVFVSFALIDRAGRRPLMLGALAIMSVCMIVLATTFLLFPLGSQVLSILALPMIMIFILAFESGPGPLFFIMASETFPVRIRDQALTLANMFQSLMNIIISLCFPVIVGALGNPEDPKQGDMLYGSGKTFMILGGVAVLGFVFVFLRLPETKGTMKQDIRSRPSFATAKDTDALLHEHAGQGPLLKGVLDTPAGVSWTPTNLGSYGTTTR